jgi:hypothetical protein
MDNVLHHGTALVTGAAFESARALGPNLSRDKPAARYSVPSAA